MTDVQILESSYFPREHSLAFHARSQRFAIMVLHRRAGKTVMCVNDLIDKAIQNHLPFPQYAYLAPFYSQAKSVAWVYLKHYAAPLIERVMESELSVVLKNGAKIRLFGCDNPDALRGNYFDGVVCDEYADMNPRVFGEILSPALADRKGFCVFIGTTKGRNHFYDLWMDAQDKESWFKMLLRADQSGIIDDDELELIRNSPGSDENTYRQEMLCDWTAAIRGSFYGELLTKLAPTNTGDFPYDPNKEVLTAWDIGYSDDTSIFFFQTNGKELAVIDFFTVAGYSVDDILSHLRTKPYAYGTFYLPHDSKNKSFQTGKSVRELMMAAGCKTQIVASLSVQDGIQAVRATLPNVYFNTSNPDVRIGLNALNIYEREYDPKNKMFREKPLHNWASNPADAFRMLALAMNPAAARKGGRVLNSKPKSVESNVMNLENLFHDRKNATRSSRI